MFTTKVYFRKACKDTVIYYYMVIGTARPFVLRAKYLNIVNKSHLAGVVLFQEYQYKNISEIINVV